MITQIAFSDHINPGKFSALIEQAERLGAIRSEVWERFGSINGIGLRDRTIRDNWLKEGKQFNVGATPWKQTLCDAIGDVKACREAAKFDVKQSIRRHTQDKDEQKRLYTLLKSDKYLDDRYLSRTMRKYFKRGHNHTHNQIIVRSDDYTVFVLHKNVWIKIPSLIKGKRIAIPLSTTVAPKGNLHIILRNNKVEIHYAAEDVKTNDCGSQTIGVDKGYTEVLTDSDGVHHGVTLGAVLTKESDRLKLKYQRRNKLKAIAKKVEQCRSNCRENGEVLQADVNAARNVLARLHDSEISRWTPYKQVKSILLKRTSANRLKLPNQDSSCRSQDLSTESELSLHTFEYVL
ncbi:hypothetical protein ABXJ76_16375 [Methylobacter sp. G7]|uniref:hypothetical protein n=1 Tax=Methylobacter sp. G7 TaxID=3230117 RepID=UPI003D801F13